MDFLCCVLGWIRGASLKDRLSTTNSVSIISKLETAVVQIRKAGLAAIGVVYRRRIRQSVSGYEPFENSQGQQLFREVPNSQSIAALRSPDRKTPKRFTWTARAVRFLLCKRRGRQIKPKNLEKPIKRPRRIRLKFGTASFGITKPVECQAGESCHPDNFWLTLLCVWQVLAWPFVRPRRDLFQNGSVTVWLYKWLSVCPGFLLFFQ
jgi:hypothetical protein